MEKVRYGAIRRRGSRARLTFRSFALLLLALFLLTLVPVFLLHSRLNQENSKKCNWLDKPPLVCAHGGDTSIGPPNTLAAYRLALDAGVDCMEIDASRTLDGILVALHDRELNSMANATGLRVGDFTYEQTFQIQQLDAGLGYANEFQGQKVPSLENALRYVSRFLKQVVIDVKVGPPLYTRNLAAEVKTAVERTHCINCVVWSKVDQVIHAYKLLSQNMAGYIVMDDSASGEMIQALRIPSAKVVGIFHGLVNDRVVSSIHGAEKQVHAWTVNKENDMVHMVEQGVDCIITSHPRLLQQVMNRLRLQCTFS